MIVSIGVAVSVSMFPHFCSSFAQPLESSYEAMAARAVSTMKPVAGERVLIRIEPKTMAGFHAVLRAAFERAGTRVDTIAERNVEGFAERLEGTDIYVWMPGASSLTTPEQRRALERWIDRGGTRRELHFHWSEGTLTRDQRPAQQTPHIDAMYADALDIDYAALDAAQDAAIRLLRSGEVRVTTPSGTDLRFRIGERPFNKQNGEGSRERMKIARMRIDRHIELPAGIVRAAPLESTVHGVLAIPAMRYGDGAGDIARDVRLEFANGKVTRVTAGERAAGVEQLLQRLPALAYFRELGLGFNPKLVMSPGSTTVPYYGYGAGFVRLSLGNNEEVGGEVRGEGVMWNFFSNATITVGATVLVRNGKLVN